MENKTRRHPRIWPTGNAKKDALYPAILGDDNDVGKVRPVA